MRAAHGRVGETDVVVRTAPDRDPLPIEPDLGRLAVVMEVDELSHGQG
jgi:hypothetical protein